MTDYFALLDQLRRPWLDSEKLQQVFHQKSRSAHPDVGGNEAAFAQMNEAHQVLQDPKRRLQHLLALEGRVPAAGEAIASDIAELFQNVADASQEAGRVQQEFTSASSPLGRSLLQSDLQRARGRLSETLERLLNLQAGADEELKGLSDSTEWTLQIPELQRLYARFAYLTRWIGELEEKRAQLSLW